MKSCRHSGQVISNDDGLHPEKILGDLHAKSVKKFEDHKMCPYRREGKGMLNLLHFDAGKWDVTKSGRLNGTGVLSLRSNSFLMEKGKDS